jgi:glycosyltransferase involved in cell wall biosynthesis
MKLLVLAQTPPPVHGQSLMVEALVRCLPAHGIDLKHVQMRLSRDQTDIGSWRLQKVFETVRSSLLARNIGSLEKRDVLYYVPAPGKRGALYRDLAAMSLCRTRDRKLVLHWHSSGLGEWLRTSATAFERSLAMRALGGADLSIVLSPGLAADAALLSPRRTVVVRNGIEDPGAPSPAEPRDRTEVLFLGLGSRDKGLIDTIGAVSLLEQNRPGKFRLTFAGNFATDLERESFEAEKRMHEGAFRYAGFVNQVQKNVLYASSDVFCFPTRYPNEGQPLSLIEAMAHDKRVITTRWRAIPEMLPSSNIWYVRPDSPSSLASMIEAAAASPGPNGAMRQHYLENFTLERHLADLSSALKSL